MPQAVSSAQPIHVTIPCIIGIGVCKLKLSLTILFKLGSKAKEMQFFRILSPSVRSPKPGRGHKIGDHLRIPRAYLRERVFCQKSTSKYHNQQKISEY